MDNWADDNVRHSDTRNMEERLLLWKRVKEECGSGCSEFVVHRIAQLSHVPCIVRMVIKGSHWDAISLVKMAKSQVQQKNSGKREASVY